MFKKRANAIPYEKNMCEICNKKATDGRHPWMAQDKFCSEVGCVSASGPRQAFWNNIIVTVDVREWFSRDSPR